MPITSILFKSRVPIPTSSASFKVLSQSSKGAEPRSPIGLKFISAIETASVQTGFNPATITPGLQGAGPETHGPSPPVIDLTPSMMDRWIGLADTRSTTIRGTL